MSEDSVTAIEIWATSPAKFQAATASVEVIFPYGSSLSKTPFAMVHN